MRKSLIIVGAILLAALIAAGSFYAGMAYQTKQAGRVRASFMQARGMTAGEMPQPGHFAGGDLPEGMQPPSGGLGFSARGTTGVVKTVEGNVMTISTAQDVTTVNLSEKTQIEKYASAAVSDLEPGARVMVTGEQDKDGTIAASRILIVDSDSAVLDFPPPAAREP